MIYQFMVFFCIPAIFSSGSDTGGIGWRAMPPITQFFANQRWCRL